MNRGLIPDINHIRYKLPGKIMHRGKQRWLQESGVKTIQKTYKLWLYEVYISLENV